MNKSVYTVLDEKAQTIGPLFVCENDDVAERLVRSSFNDPNSIVCRYPADFALFRLGVIVTSTGAISACGEPVLVNKLDVILKV